MIRTDKLATSVPASGTTARAAPSTETPSRTSTASPRERDPWAGLGLPELGDVVRRISSLCGWTQVRADVGQTLAITSAIQGEGKSSLASAVAISTARDHAAPVLLVECDLARPHATHDFALRAGPGLSDVLAQEVDLFSALYTTRIPNLRILPAGGRGENPSRLLRSAAMPELFEEIRRNFAFTILDLPAVLRDSNAAVLARLADGAVLVVRSGVTAQRDVQHAVRDLSGAVLHGIVLNRWRSAIPTLVRGMLEP